MSDSEEDSGMRRQTSICLLFAAALALLCLLPPGIDAQDRRSGKPKLELKLSTTKLMMCVGSAIPLELQITNRTERPVKIESSAVWKNFTYSFEAPTPPRRSGSHGSTCGGCDREFVTLKPGESYETRQDFELIQPHFKDVGEYTLSTGFEKIRFEQINLYTF